MAAFERRKQFRYLTAHEIETGTGSDKSRAILLFHVFTECNTDRL